MELNQARQGFLDAFQKSGLTNTDLSGQTVIVTGSGRGIGRWAAIAMACAGAHVVVAEISTEGQAVAGEIIASGGDALYVPCDVSNLRSVHSLAGMVHAHFGPVDVLVNNAILCPTVPLLSMSVALWDQVMAVNLRGTFLTCKTFLPDLLASRRGIIVNMSSTDAMPALSAYIASKQGIVGFTQSIAAEVSSQGVRVIAFAPGLVDTPGIRGAATGLAPHLGLSEEEFLKLSFHPAYPGMMPAEHAGLATAYLVAKLADEYQGEVVTGYTVLERAGVIAPPHVPPPLPVEKTIPAPNTRNQSDLRALATALQEMLAATEIEFNRLPVFVRPMARSGFKNHSGQSLAEWQRGAARFEGLLVSPGTANNQADLQAEIDQLMLLLPKLIEYFANVPKETARFTRDEETLREVSRVADERVGVLKELIDGLLQ